MIHQVSRERVRDELTKMLTEGHARTRVRAAGPDRPAEHVLPEIDRMQGVEQPPQYPSRRRCLDPHADAAGAACPPSCSRTLAWGALLHDVGKPPTFRVAPDRIRFDGHVEVGVEMAEEICQRLHFSNEDTEQIAGAGGQSHALRRRGQDEESTLKRFMRLPRFDEHMELHRLDCLSSHRHLRKYDIVTRPAGAHAEEEIRRRRCSTETT